MSFDYGAISENPRIDPKVIREIESNSRMSGEQGSSFMAAYGGPNNYVQMASMPIEQRLTYAAILDGHSTATDIASVTGLSSTQVSKGMASLTNQGLISTSSGQLEVEVS